MYFDEFQNRLKGNLPGICLFFGDSTSTIAEGNRSILEKFRKAHPEGSILTYEGGETDLGQILSTAQTTSLFASAQLLIARNAEKLLGGHSEKAIALLKEYAANPNPSSYLVFLAAGLRKTAKAVTALERIGWAVQCYDLPEWKLAGWLKQQAQTRGLNLSEEGAQLLVQKIGTDMAYLRMALDQLADYVYPQKAISLETVKELPVPGIESGVFDFLDAVGLRQSEKALQLMGRLEEGVDVGTLLALYARIRELLRIALEKAQGLGQTAVGENLGLHPFRLKSLWEQAGQFTPEELKTALRDLIRLQAGVVTGRLSRTLPALSLEIWVLKWGKKQRATATR